MRAKATKSGASPSSPPALEEGEGIPTWSEGEINRVLMRAAERLRAAGIDSPRREARLLLRHALNVRLEEIVAGYVPRPGPAALRRFEALLARRAVREPLAYIVGEREFWSLPFTVGPGVLIPRPESETLTEEALRRFPDRDAHLRFLDLGTGSGCLLLAFLSERPNAQGVGIDISEAALAVAAENAAALGLKERARFARGDWMDGLSGRFDGIFVNPPYIPAGELTQLEPEVARYEPRGALDGGDDGLSAYRRIAAALGSHLAPAGRAFLEVGQGQAKPVEAVLAKNGLNVDGTVFDLAGISRCLVVGVRQDRYSPKKQLAIETRSG